MDTTEFSTNCSHHAYAMACSLAYAIKDMPQDSEMRRLATERLIAYCVLRREYQPDGPVEQSTQWLLDVAEVSTFLSVESMI